MAYRKKTLRTMSPTARKVARLAGELDSVSRRLKNLVPDLQRLDLDSRALFNKRAYEDKPTKEGEAELETIFEEPD
jgi:hypothetical protein